jgi:D-amino-acid dehydrogenase
MRHSASNIEDKQDVVIVGGGTIGIACAHYLTDAGMKVTVIDKGSIAAACSAGNCGYICASHILPLTEPEALWTGLKSLFNPRAAFRIRPTLRPELWIWMLQFMRRCNQRQMLVAGKALQALLESSLQEYHGLMEQEKLACEWKEKGLLFVFKGEHGMEQFAEMDRFITKHFGVSANRIDGPNLPDFDAALQQGLTGAFHYPNDASLRPDLLNSRWVENLRSKGVRFIENCSLEGVTKDGGKIQNIDSTKGCFEAERFVFATGAWSAKLAPLLSCRIPVEPGKGYSITMARPSRCPSHPMLFPEKRVGVSPFEQGYRLGSMMEFSGFDTSIPEQRIRQLRSSAEDFLVEPHTEEVLDTWYGWRPMTWDSLPIIGQVPNLKNSYLATGHNMLGLATATGSGRLLAELVAEKPTHIDPAPYSPDRF